MCANDGVAYQLTEMVYGDECEEWFVYDVDVWLGVRRQQVIRPSWVCVLIGRKGLISYGGGLTRHWTESFSMGCLPHLLVKI